MLVAVFHVAVGAVAHEQRLAAILLQGEIVEVVSDGLNTAVELRAILLEAPVDAWEISPAEASTPFRKFS